MRTYFISGRLAGAALVVAAFAFVSPRPASAQDAAQSERLRGSMSASAFASFNATLAAAREHGLPTEPLVSKAMEGAAKGVPGDRIASAVRDLSNRMARAQIVLRAGVGAKRAATSAEIVAVADALQRNVPEDVLRRLSADAAGRASIAASSYAMADLVSQGVPVAVGVEVLTAWRARGADPASLHEVSATVERLVRQGVAPARAGSGVAAGLRLGIALSTITNINLPK